MSINITKRNVSSKEPVLGRKSLVQSIKDMVWYGMVNVDLYSAVITKVSNALNTCCWVSGEKPCFQALSKGLIVLPCAEIARQGVPDMLPYYCGSECTREKPRAANGRRQRSDAVAIKSAAVARCQSVAVGLSSWPQQTWRTLTASLRSCSPSLRESWSCWWRRQPPPRHWQSLMSRT